MACRPTSPTRGGLVAHRRPARARHCATPRVELVDPLAQARGLVRVPCPPLGPSARRPRLRASRRRKSGGAVSRDILERLAATCGADRLVDVRGRAIRRRSEIARLRLEQLRDEPPVSSDPADPASTPRPCLSIRLGRTKTTEADEMRG